MKSQDILETLSAKQRNLYQKDFDELEDDIEKVDMYGLIASVCKSTSSLGTEEIMLGLFKHWKNFSYEDWKNVICKMKDNEIGLINLIAFVGKYLNVDLRPELDSVQTDKKEYVLNYLHKETPLFYYDERRNSKILERFHLSFDTSFSKTRERLIREGCVKAKVVTPKKVTLLDFPNAPK